MADIDFFLSLLYDTLKMLLFWSLLPAILNSWDISLLFALSLLFWDLCYIGTSFFISHISELSSYPVLLFIIPFWCLRVWFSGSLISSSKISVLLVNPSIEFSFHLLPSSNQISCVGSALGLLITFFYFWYFFLSFFLWNCIYFIFLCSLTHYF